jgi:hypothetical protein
LSSIGERISRWRGKLINTNNIARSEASDFVWTPKNVTDKFAIEGLTNLGTYMENPARLTTGIRLTTTRISVVNGSGFSK